MSEIDDFLKALEDHPIDDHINDQESEDESNKRLMKIIENWYRLSEEDRKCFYYKLVYMANRSRHGYHPSKLN